MLADEQSDPVPGRPERWLTALAMVGVGLLSLIVTITVVSRWLYHAMIPDDVLLVREIMIWVILLPLGAVSVKRMHIAVTIFTDRARPAALRILDKVGTFIGSCFVALLLWAGCKLFLDAWESGEYYDGDINIPMWITQAVYVIALAAFLARLLLILFSRVDQGKGHG